MRCVWLAAETDTEGWRREARALLRAGVAPHAVSWGVAGPVGDPRGSGPLDACEPTPGLFDGAPPRDDDDGAPGCAGVPAPRVPAAFPALADSALLHRDPGRFALLYRLLWRLQQEPGLRGDPLDADWLAAQALAQAVHRDQHKMRAFVRFHERPTPLGPQYVAWFEPGHHTLASQAGFFQRRFARMRWAIFTPDASIAWDGHCLHHGGPARRDEIPTEDATQALWLTYYASIFNPARLKLATMAQHMPRKYWHNLPEARLIAPLAAAAAQRAEAMVERPGTLPHRRRTVAMVPADPSHRDPPAAGADPHAALAAVRAQAQACTACAHGRQATQAVAGEGPPGAALMLVGEQPGDQEDLQGRAFVGPAGQLLDRALAEAGIAREAVYLTNAVKHFGFTLRGTRRLHKTPGQQEVLACSRWLDEEIALVQPTRLLALGATAARALLGAAVSVSASRGAPPLRRPQDGLEVHVTWHPAALLRMPPDERERAWPRWVADLRAAASQIGVAR
ncbi:UdgX family uracil-DNA binding protein [Ideonella sp.]|uniref:UdgX family uracil-DNA binding protein n=1 Tax=Ideonella sp. TaxID=1929293 RepID=UPI0035B06AC3